MKKISALLLAMLLTSGCGSLLALENGSYFNSSKGLFPGVQTDLEIVSKLPLVGLLFLLDIPASFVFDIILTPLWFFSWVIDAYAH